MKYTTINVDFGRRRYSDIELIAKANEVITKMTGNTDFPTPSPTLDIIQQSRDDFEQAQSTAVKGSPADTEAKNRLRDDLEENLKLLAFWVNKEAKGDRLKLMSTGFELPKERAPLGPMPVPPNFSAVRGIRPGEVVMQCDAVRNATYVFEYRKAVAEGQPETPWTVELSGKRKFTVTNLETKTDYEFRMYLAGADPSKIYSTVIKIFVI